MTGTRDGTVPLLVAAAVFGALIAALVLQRAPGATPLQLGGPAPDFELETLEGPPLRLSELRGQVVFVNFWATWCPPCREEAPALQRIYRELRYEGLEILAISIDAPNDRDAVASFRDEYGLAFPILLDPDQSVHAAYGVTGVPETYLITPEGRVAERFIGPRNWDQPRYASAVRRLLRRTEARDG